jgi:hypothetical protein
MTRRAVTALALAVMFALLLWRLSVFFDFGALALSFPFSLDYGEGIVWQQALLLFTPEAYGRIDGFPAIVFQYPPVYHAVTRAVAALAGTDMLYTGRAVSMAATLLTAVIIGLVVARAAPTGATRAERVIAGSAGALALFCLMPVYYWAPLMRVDMLAIALSFAGFWFGLKAFERSVWIVPAALCFVAAVYTKQTSIAAPLGLFGLMLWLRPKLALAGFAICLVTGLAALLALAAATDNGFLRHVFLYNINRVNWKRLNVIVWAVTVHAGFVGIALLIAWRRVAEAAGSVAGLKGAQRRAAILANRGLTTYCAILAYALATLPTLLLLIKVGSDVNYVMEWLFTVVLLVGTALYDAAHVATNPQRGNGATAWRTLAAIVLPLVVAAQALSSTVSRSHIDSRQWLVALGRLAARVRAAQKPVVSDDMAMLLRLGKRVVWEPAIFSELASVGIWDEKPFVARIGRHEFSMFITLGQRGMPIFDQRYRPAIAQAIEQAYPIKQQFGGYTLHLPDTTRHQPAGTRAAPPR